MLATELKTALGPSRQIRPLLNYTGSTAPNYHHSQGALEVIFRR